MTGVWQLLRGMLVVGCVMASSCSGASISSDDPAYGTPLRVVSPVTGSVWNVTVGEPVLAREVSPSSSAYVVDVDLELVEADAGDTTWEFRWELLGGGSADTYVAFPSELLDPPACPLPRTTFTHGKAPVGYAISGSVCFLVLDPRDIANPNTRVSLGTPIDIEFSQYGQVGEDPPTSPRMVPQGLPFGTRVEVSESLTQSTPWYIEMAPVQELDDDAWPTWDFDPLPPSAVRVGITYQIDALVDPGTLAPPDLFVLGGASGQVSRQSCDLLRSIA